MAHNLASPGTIFSRAILDIWPRVVLGLWPPTQQQQIENDRSFLRRSRKTATTVQAAAINTTAAAMLLAMAPTFFLPVVPPAGPCVGTGVGASELGSITALY